MRICGWKVLHWPISQSAVQRSRNKQATARMTSLLIVILTTRVACITRFDQWDIFNDVTFQNIPRNSPDVVAEILCVAGSLGRRMEKCVNDLSCDGRTIIVRWSQVKNIVLRLFKNRHWFANRITNQYRLFLVGSDFVFGLTMGSEDCTIGEKIGSDLPIL